MNGDPGPFVFVPGDLRLTLDMQSNGMADDLLWFWAIASNGKVFWITSGGISPTIGPLWVAPPIDVVDLELIDAALPPGSTLSSVMLLWDGGQIVASDVILGYGVE